MHGIANKVVYEELWGPGLQEKEAQRGDLALVGSFSLKAVTDLKKTTERLITWADPWQSHEAGR